MQFNIKITASAETFHKPRILIVEDERVTALALSKILTKQGYEVIGTCANGVETIEFVSREKPDLILMDIVFGDSDGPNGIETAKLINEKNKIPIIFSTATTDEETIAKAREARPYGFIVKPYINTKLYAEIQIALYKAEQDKSLAESEAKYRDLFENAVSGIVLLNKAGEYVEVNQSAEKITGYSRAELSKMKMKDLLHPDDIEKVRLYFSLLKKEKDKDALRCRIISKSSQVKWLDVYSSLIYDSTGKVTGTRDVFIDITDYILAEKQRLEHEQLFNIMDKQSLYALGILQDGRFKYINKVGADMYNLSVEEMLHLDQYKFREMLHPEDIELFISHARERKLQANNNMGTVIEYRLKMPDGKDKWIEQYTKPIRYQGKPAYFVTGFDITHIKQKETAVREAFYGTVTTLSKTVEMRDPYTAGHQTRVADLSRAVAREMELPPEKIDGLRLAANLHDLGKMTVPAEILTKPGKLNEAEFNLIKDHAQTGYNVLKDIKFPWPIADIAHQHHERIDGKGYPRGLVASEILIEAKILAVADTIEAIASHRPYRPAIGLDKALEIIQNDPGYDPEVIKATLKVFAKGFKFRYEDFK